MENCVQETLCIVKIIVIKHFKTVFLNICICAYKTAFHKSSHILKIISLQKRWQLLFNLNNSHWNHHVLPFCWHRTRMHFSWEYYSHTTIQLQLYYDATTAVLQYNFSHTMIQLHAWLYSNCTMDVLQQPCICTMVQTTANRLKFIIMYPQI